jgi:IS30 family transposase
VLQIDKDRSIVYRERKRNSDERNGDYKAQLAHTKATNRHNEKAKKIRFTPEIEAYVLKYIAEDYSPEQIVGKAKIDGKDCVSLE